MPVGWLLRAPDEGRCRADRVRRVRFAPHGDPILFAEV